MKKISRKIVNKETACSGLFCIWTKLVFTCDKSNACPKVAAIKNTTRHIKMLDINIMYRSSLFSWAIQQQHHSIILFAVCMQQARRWALRIHSFLENLLKTYQNALFSNAHVTNTNLRCALLSSFDQCHTFSMIWLKSPLSPNV